VRRGALYGVFGQLGPRLRNRVVPPCVETRIKNPWRRNSMAIRGRKRAPPALRLLTGSHLSDRPIPGEPPYSLGKPVKPKWLIGRGAELWDEVLTFAFWLTMAESYKLAAWCEGQAEFESLNKRRKWSASDRREHRAAASELGIASRVA
jgi:hypothetical protein